MCKKKQLSLTLMIGSDRQGHGLQPSSVRIQGSAPSAVDRHAHAAVGIEAAAKVPHSPRQGRGVASCFHALWQLSETGFLRFLQAFLSLTLAQKFMAESRPPRMYPM